MLKLFIVCIKNLNAHGLSRNTGHWLGSRYLKSCWIIHKCQESLKRQWYKIFKNAYSYCLKTFQTDWIFSQEILSYFSWVWQFLGYLEGLLTNQKFWRKYKMTVWKPSQILINLNYPFWTKRIYKKKLTTNIIQVFDECVNFHIICKDCKESGSFKKHLQKKK